MTQREDMSRECARLVVVVRCPLCGGWMLGNQSSTHLDAYHPESRLGGDLGPPRALSDVYPGPDGGMKKLISCLPEAEAEALLVELGIRLKVGQDAAIGFEIYEPDTV